MNTQKNAIYYHGSNGKPLNCYRLANAKRLAITMADRVLITLVANDGSATLGHILGVHLEDGSGHKYIVRLLNKSTGKVVCKFVQAVANPS